ncbi:hypothetical protein [Hymenobacter psychrophilus]|uniref:Uncharacterized protein n=1 Tax=Hymenobacter psychrophilus TaxID=651662 RepID=A0A1H3PDM7_9BACT|nr:hypothetical protein [Hymenobacter psychrophilus]SDY99063.1 hypothetical protein SAMN04488069_1295 [Hymenobacter psychrophilus]
MNLTFITPAIRGVRNTAEAPRMATVSRGSGTISFSASFMQQHGPAETLATLAKDADTGHWYALFGHAAPEADSRELRHKKAKAGKATPGSRYFINKALVTAVLTDAGIPEDRNSAQFPLLPEPVEHAGLVLWPLGTATLPALPIVKATVKPASAPVSKPALVATPAPTGPTPTSPALSPVAAGPARPVASIPDASTERLHQRRDHLLSSSKPLKPLEVKELNALQKELQSRGELVSHEAY